MRKPLNVAARAFFQMVQRRLPEVQAGWIDEVRINRGEPASAND